MNYEISKFKQKKGQLEVHYRQQQGELIKEYQVILYCMPHPDLAAAMDRLKAHLCFITELIEPYSLPYLKEKTTSTAFTEDEFYEEPAFLRFTCTGLSLSGDGVVLIGQKSLSTKKVLNITSPFTLLDEESDYDYSAELSEQVLQVLQEVNLLLAGKLGSIQLDLFEQDQAA